MLMSKDEIDKSATWAANAEAPLTREQQILLMTTARERHNAYREQIRQLLKENKMS